MWFQVDDPGFQPPQDVGTAIVWIIFLGVLVGLWVVVSRTRRRAEEDFWERKRAERERRRD